MPVTWAPSDTLPTTSTVAIPVGHLGDLPLNASVSQGYAGAPSRIAIALSSASWPAQSVT